MLSEFCRPCSVLFEVCLALSFLHETTATNVATTTKTMATMNLLLVFIVVQFKMLFYSLWWTFPCGTTSHLTIVVPCGAMSRSLPLALPRRRRTGTTARAATGEAVLPQRLQGGGRRPSARASARKGIVRWRHDRTVRHGASP